MASAKVLTANGKGLAATTKGLAATKKGTTASTTGSAARSARTPQCCSIEIKEVEDVDKVSSCQKASEPITIDKLSSKDKGSRHTSNGSEDLAEEMAKDELGK